MFNNTTHNHFLPISNTLSIEAASGLGRPSHAEQSSAASSTSDAPFLSHAASGVKKRKPTKFKSGKELSRSFSTPQLRDGAMSDSDSDKKRNKLGYQRISIACVDQQAAMEGRPETSATLLAGSGPSSIVSVSPPNLGMDRPLASAHDFSAFSAVPSNAPGTYQRLPLEPGSALLGQQPPQRFLPTEPDPRLGGFVQPNHIYRAETDTRSWSASETLESGGSRLLARRTEASSQVYAQYANSPTVRGDFAPYPASTEPTRTQKAFHRMQGAEYPQHTEGMQWEPSPQPAPPLSYAPIDQQPPPNHHHHHLPHHQQPPYQPSFRPDQRVHAPPTMHHYPLSALDVQTANLAPDGRGPLSAPVGAHQVYSQANAFLYHQQQQQQQQQSHGGGGGGVNASSFAPHATFPPAGWYAEPQGYAALEEEPEEFEGSPELRPG
ncbi:hypothetical protein LTR91_006276 [Friedmanniomyces endolithicus]|uniref:Uncharacterized protein n=1 Tax=Friedmanniomyces endolithicus TaxID=329885 RepID=A0AAN6JE13_9PEZI|nr:hypothetical protein LTS09_007347 [Friedmanniomyces endolithicus]KAK0288015.1 hypothetical protein LTR35_003488 [Friedmanniomyces endolithicus]KAK0294073.1 hypothetical protein LTS00_007413 [Friedmanniomyces endolithicus]KAK0326248.1 hypothetical protein LTR82_002994 [Friedmanniomyces endolithicus]KAK0929031.1 hypothetical protein LTR57_002105 [Friedmanniomyces endolithicus]